MYPSPFIPSEKTSPYLVVDTWGPPSSSGTFLGRKLHKAVALKTVRTNQCNLGLRKPIRKHGLTTIMINTFPNSLGMIKKNVLQELVFFLFFMEQMPKLLKRFVKLDLYVQPPAFKNLPDDLPLGSSLLWVLCPSNE
jgi:hypothetical protein